MELSVWFRFALAVLATWRVTHLLAREDGPADLIVRLRLRLGSGFVGNMMDCFHCLSVWVSLPMAYFVTGNFGDLLVTCLALSGGACLLERLGREPVIFQQNSQLNGGNGDGMLRTETGNSEENLLD